MPRSRKLSDEQIAGVIETEITQAQGGEYGQSSLMENRRQAWNYFLGRPRGDEDPDGARSQLQSLDVADQVEHVLAQMMGSFTTDSPAEFEGEGPGDDTQAQLESAAVSNLIMEANPGYEVLYQAIKDALLFKNGFVKVWVEDATDRQTVTLDGVDDADADLVEAAVGETDDLTVERGDDTVTLAREVEERRLKVAAIEPASFHYTSNWHEQDLQEIPFCGERKFYVRSKLLAMGYSKSVVNALPAFTMDTKSDSYAKFIDESSDPQTGSTRGQDVIEVWETYVHLPKNLRETESESERWRVVSSQRKILEKEKVDIVPYVSGTAFLVPHRLTGQSLFDKLKEIQDAKTAGIRQYTDNMAHNNAARFFVTGDVNRQELGVSAPGHHITGSIGSTLTPIPVADIGPSALSYLSYLDKIRSERGGAAIDMGSPESQLVNSQIGATGVALVMGAQEVMSAAMTRTMSETLIRRLFLLVHRVAREQYRQPMLLRRADSFEQANPATWAPRKRVNVKTGLSPGERARKVSALQQVMQAQLGLQQSGSTLVTPQNVYRSMMNWAKAAELDNPEQYFVHPESQAAAQMGQQQAQQAEQMKQLEVSLQRLPEETKMAIAQLQDATDRFKAQLDAQVEEMKVVGKATGDIEIEQLRARNAEQSSGDSGANGRDQPARES